MSFKNLLAKAKQPKQREQVLHGMLRTYKGVHHIFNIPTGGGKSKLMAATISDLLEAGESVLAITTKSKEELLTQVLAGLTDYNYQDLQNPNFKNKPQVEEKINEVSEKYDHKLSVESVSQNFTALDNCLEQYKGKITYIIITNLDHFAGSDYAKGMNKVVTYLNNFAKEYDVSIISATSSPNQDSGYLQNKESEVVFFVNPPYGKGKTLIIADETHNNDYFQSPKGVTLNNKVRSMVIDPPYGSTHTGLNNSFKYNNEEDSLTKKHMKMCVWLLESKNKNIFDIQTIGRFKRQLDFFPGSGEVTDEELEDQVSNLSMDLEEALDQEVVDYKLVKKLSAKINELSGKLAK